MIDPGEFSSFIIDPERFDYRSISSATRYRSTGKTGVTCTLVGPRTAAGRRTRRIFDFDGAEAWSNARRNATATTATAVATDRSVDIEPLADPEAGYETLVVTTDPAAHLEDVFGEPVGHEPTSVSQANLDAVRIDQEKALEEYRTQVLDHVIGMYEDWDTEIDVEAAVANVEEEFESPCAEEMAALEKVSLPVIRVSWPVLRSERSRGVQTSS